MFKFIIALARRGELRLLKQTDRQVERITIQAGQITRRDRATHATIDQADEIIAQEIGRAQADGLKVKAHKIQRR